MIWKVKYEGERMSPPPLFTAYEYITYANKSHLFLENWLRVPAA